MISVGDFGHINNILLMKTTSFNAGEGYVSPNQSNVIPILMLCPAKVTFILPDLCDIDKCKQLFLYDKMI